MFLASPRTATAQRAQAQPGQRSRRPSQPARGPRSEGTRGARPLPKPHTGRAGHAPREPFLRLPPPQAPARSAPLTHQPRTDATSAPTQLLPSLPQPTPEVRLRPPTRNPALGRGDERRKAHAQLQRCRAECGGGELSALPLHSQRASSPHMEEVAVKLNPEWKTGAHPFLPSKFSLAPASVYVIRRAPSSRWPRCVSASGAGSPAGAPPKSPTRNGLARAGLSWLGGNQPRRPRLQP